MLIKNAYTVIVSGNDVTSRFAPFLESMEITKSAGETTDSISLKLHDKDGSLFMPQERAPIQAYLAGEPAFDGFVSEVSCSISKGGGRKMDISGSSVDQGGKAKEASLRNKDNAKFSEVAQEWGQKVGLTVSVSGDIGAIQRPYWLMQHESFMSWGQRTAKDIGATFKVVGNRAFFVSRNAGLSVTGRPLTPVRAAVGFNLIEGSITPIISRPKFNKAGGSYFDKNEGEHVEVEVDTGVEGVDVKLKGGHRSASKDHAKDKATSRGKGADREQGDGSITLIGAATAEPEAPCQVTGWRSGIDGTYRIDSVTHSVDKSGGFTTQLGLKQPKGGAGKDAR